MPAFDMIVVGSGGGNDETNLSCYLIKLRGSKWEDGILALEAGSGVGALSKILKQHPKLLGNESLSANRIFSLVHSYFITHSHMDHISSLVISAGSMGGPRKRICASRQNLENIASIFQDRVWPNLGSWKDHDESWMYHYTPLPEDASYITVAPGVSLRTMPISHGYNDTVGVVDSAAFFIRRDSDASEFLFFGDVEPDSVSRNPRTIHVWKAAAPKIPDTLNTIFIECSYPCGRNVNTLYGHLTPEYLVEELETLAHEVLKARPGRPEQRITRRSSKLGPLNGLRVYITHCKSDWDLDNAGPISEIITDQVRVLADAKKLGCEIVAANQGMLIEI